MKKYDVGDTVLLEADEEYQEMYASPVMTATIIEVLENDRYVVRADNGEELNCPGSAFLVD